MRKVKFYTPTELCFFFLEGLMVMKQGYFPIYVSGRQCIGWVPQGTCLQQSTPVTFVGQACPEDPHRWCWPVPVHPGYVVCVYFYSVYVWMKELCCLSLWSGLHIRVVKICNILIAFGVWYLIVFPFLIDTSVRHFGKLTISKLFQVWICITLVVLRYCIVGSRGATFIT